MTRTSLWAIACAVSCLVSCTDSADKGPDSAPDGAAVDAAPPDAAPPDAAPIDPGACEPDKLWNFIADRPIVVGDYCDDIQLCAPSAASADAIASIQPGFVCEEAGCVQGQWQCAWSDPDDLDADEYASLCAITVLEAAPEQLTCMIYL